MKSSNIAFSYAIAIPVALLLLHPAEKPVEPPEPIRVNVQECKAIMPEIPVEDYENEKIEAALLDMAHRIDECIITYYCCEPYAHICGNGDGLAATGTKATPGVTCAVDPSVIPLGSDVLVDYGDGEIFYFRAEDTGGGIRGNHIDVCMDRHREALDMGRRVATVYWAEAE